MSKPKTKKEKPKATKAKPVVLPEPRKPTPEEVLAEIATLKDYRERVLHYSAFGDDHRASIAAQIAVLHENLDDDDIYLRYGVSPEEEDEGVEQPSIIGQALDARQWLDGESEDGPPSGGWKSLLRK